MLSTRRPDFDRWGSYAGLGTSKKRRWFWVVSFVLFMLQINNTPFPTSDEMFWGWMFGLFIASVLIVNLGAVLVWTARRALSRIRSA